MLLSPQESREFESELARLLQQAAEREAELRERAGRRDRRERRDLYDPDPREPRVVPRHRGQHRQPPRWGRRREAGQQGAATAGQAGEDASTRWLRRVNVALVVSASAIVALLSVLGGVMSYEPLREAAASCVPGPLTAWWPLLVYGPWLVASLSVLRGALHQRRVPHSWLVLMTFSGFAVILSVAGAPRDLTALAVAGLPPVSALVAFHQVVRQMALVNQPRHALPRPRGRGWSWLA